MELIYDFIGPVVLKEFNENLYATTETGVYVLVRDVYGNWYFKQLGFEKQQSTSEED